MSRLWVSTDLIWATARPELERMARETGGVSYGAAKNPPVERMPFRVNTVSAIGRRGRRSMAGTIKLTTTDHHRIVAARPDTMPNEVVTLF